MSLADSGAETWKANGFKFDIKKLYVIKPLLIALTVPVCLLVIWELLSRAGVVRPSILPAPSVIGLTMLDMAQTGEIFRHLAISIFRVLQGFVLGALLGIICGFLVGLSKMVEKAFALIIGILRPIPIIAWVPVLILWMGIDEASKVTIIAIASFWSLLVNVVDGVKNTDKKYLEVARILEKSNITLVTKVIFPSTLPAIFTGLRIGIDVSWRSVVGAELIAASSGIGYMIMYARELSQIDVMLVGVFVIGLTGLFIDVVLKKLQAWALKWNVNYLN